MAAGRVRDELPLSLSGEDEDEDEDDDESDGRSSLVPVNSASDPAL